MSVVIKLQLKNYDQIVRAFKQVPARMTVEMTSAIDRCITRLEADTKKQAPVNKQSGGGNLRQSIRSRMLGPARGVVEVESGYAIFVHEGTRPHIIRIKQKRVLANRRMGQIFGTVVHHPGTRANPFLQRAVDNNSAFFDKQFEIAIENAIK